MKTLENAVLPLSKEESLAVRNEIMHATDIWCDYNNALDAFRSSQLWLNTNELRFAQDGVFFESFDALADFIKSTYDECENMVSLWKMRFIQPLTHEIALFSGIYYFKLNYPDGRTWNGDVAFTATFIKRNGEWKIINGHESIKQE